MRSSSTVPNILQALTELEDYVFEQVHDCVRYQYKIVIFSVEKRDRLKSILSFHSFVNLPTVKRIIKENNIENWVALWEAMMKMIGIKQTQNSYEMREDGAIYNIEPIFNSWFEKMNDRTLKKIQTYQNLEWQLLFEPSSSMVPASDPLVQEITKIADGQSSSSSTTFLLESFIGTTPVQALLHELECYLFNLIKDHYSECRSGVITDPKIALALYHILTIKNFTSANNKYISDLFKQYQIKNSEKNRIAKALYDRIGLGRNSYRFMTSFATIKLDSIFTEWFQRMKDSHCATVTPQNAPAVHQTPTVFAPAASTREIVLLDSPPVEQVTKRRRKI